MDARVVVAEKGGSATYFIPLPLRTLGSKTFSPSGLIKMALLGSYQIDHKATLLSEGQSQA